MRRLSIAFALAACLGLLLVAPGLGRTTGSVTVKVTPTTAGAAKYSGKVSSNKSRCRKGRKVSIYHDSDPPFLIGETETDSDGKYSFEGISPPSGDRVFVVVKPKGNGRRRCKELNDSAKVP